MPLSYTILDWKSLLVSKVSIFTRLLPMLVSSQCSSDQHCHHVEVSDSTTAFMIKQTSNRTPKRFWKSAQHVAVACSGLGQEVRPQLEEAKSRLDMPACLCDAVPVMSIFHTKKNDLGAFTTRTKVTQLVGSRGETKPRLVVIHKVHVPPLCLLERYCWRKLM